MAGIFDTGADPNSLPQIQNGPMSDIFGMPTSTGVSGEPTNPKGVVPAEATPPAQPVQAGVGNPPAQGTAPQAGGIMGFLRNLANPTTAAPVVSPEAATNLTPDQLSQIRSTQGEDQAKKIGRLAMLAGPFGLPLMLMMAGAVQGQQGDKAAMIKNAMDQYSAAAKGAKTPEELAEIQAKTKQYISEALLNTEKRTHPGKFRANTTVNANQRNDRELLKDFNTERDNQVKRAEDAVRIKFGSQTLPFSSLEHEAMMADAEEGLVGNYPNVKQTKKFQESRELKAAVDEMLGKMPDADVKKAILLKKGLTPSRKADLLGYIDSLKTRKGMPVSEGEAGTPPEVPAGQPGYFQKLLNAVRGK